MGTQRGQAQGHRNIPGHMGGHGRQAPGMCVCVWGHSGHKGDTCGDTGMRGCVRGGRARVVGVVPGTEGQRTLWWHCCHPRRLAAGGQEKGEGRGQGHGGGSPETWTWGSWCGLIPARTWGHRHVWSCGGPFLGDRAVTRHTFGGPGDVGGPEDCGDRGVSGDTGTWEARETRQLGRVEWGVPGSPIPEGPYRAVPALRTPEGGRGGGPGPSRRGRPLGPEAGRVQERAHR